MGLAAATRPDPAVSTGAAHVALIGNPNTGKTTLFNRLCAARAKTSNFPGTTTSTRTGRAELPGGRAIQVVDLPGLYELQLDYPETRIARDVLGGVGVFRRPDLVVCLVDACNLTRNLVLVGELLAYDVPLVVVLNMVDLAQRRGLTVNAATLTRRLGVPVVPMVARTGEGFETLQAVMARALEPLRPQVRPADLPRSGSVDDLTAWADGILAEAAAGSSIDGAVDTFTESLDRTFTHPVLGVLAFLAVMGALFWTLFALATIPMDLIEATFAQLGALAHAYLPAGPVRDLVTDGIIGGIAGTVVFLPQICLLFFLISLLEDTGYLARAAFVMDRALHRFGLPGHAFVPLLTAHACALPGIMSTRLIPDRRDRLATIFVVPFMSCSARMPVYVLLTSLLFARQPAFAAMVFAGCYLLGNIAALFSAWLLSRTWLKGTAQPMVLELPTYKVPSLTNAILTAKDQGVAFLKTAGTVIMAICIVMWWLSSYPSSGPSPEGEARRAEASALSSFGGDADTIAALEAEADALDARARQSGSFAGDIGRGIQPVFAPLGYDWQLTVGVVTSFLAREVFVSTMSVLAGAGSETEVDEGIITRIRTMTRDDGEMVFTFARSASALVFFVLAMQCLPTLAVTRKETGRVKYAALQLLYMSSLAYVAALVVYQGLRMAGIS
ncbi:MAG: ferrous iron transporter B [Vicinamibacteraceae bacterium]|nr:ferrous iron transporter B [Vicinamibacteraceae bacterium]